mmetsp:Transcript_29607/g.68233  ORF Transcript_29607/g.68233 Transcript_29607/m.68233 type:complete len:202 (-) Transcript_29607:54-659(-)
MRRTEEVHWQCSGVRGESPSNTTDSREETCLRMYRTTFLNTKGADSTCTPCVSSRAGCSQPSSASRINRACTARSKVLHTCDTACNTPVKALGGLVDHMSRYQGSPPAAAAVHPWRVASTACTTSRKMLPAASLQRCRWVNSGSSRSPSVTHFACMSASFFKTVSGECLRHSSTSSYVCLRTSHKASIKSLSLPLYAKNSR